MKPNTHFDLACFRRLSSALVCAALAVLAPLTSACGSSATEGADGGLDGALPDGYVPIPKTEACKGDKTACLSGTVSLEDFKGQPTASRVTLYKVFPHGNNPSITWVPVAMDGTFAFSDLPAWDHYYLEAAVTFGSGANEHSVASVVGSLTLPSAGTAISIVVRPVYLEILQQTAPPTANSLAWASAHLYDPTTGDELTSGSVSLTVGGKPVDMPYGANAGGTMSFYVALPTGTAGGTSFTITTSAPAFGSSPLTWNLVGDPATFQGAILSPTSTAPVDKPLTVTWQAVPDASFSETELFVQSGSGFTPTYTSPEVNAPNVTSETIPASALSAAGAYLLNESYSNATCPASADGCVYNVSTAAANLTVN
jgi:hypothetical protein